MASVDVVVPCYQYGRYLRDCVGSVLSQGIPDVRVLIIDNASTDNSVEVARQLAAEDARVSVVARPRNLGAHASFNEGIEWAAADYFMILCADDLLTPGSLARSIEIMDPHPDVCLTFGTEYHWRTGEPMPAGIQAAEGASWQILTGAQFIETRCRKLVAGLALVRTAVQKEVGYYRPELPFTDDLDMLLRLASRGSVAVTPQYQSIRRVHGSNMCDVHGMDRAQDLVQRSAAFESFFARDARLLASRERLHRLARRSLAERGYWWGLRALAAGQIHQGLELMKFALRTHPAAVFSLPASYLYAASDRARAAASGQRAV